VRIAESLVKSHTRRALCILVIVVMVSMQRIEWPVRYSVAAAQTDALNTGNAVDADAGLLRIADAAHGRRAVMLLSDEALPRGTFDVVIRMKSAAESTGEPIAHAWVQTEAAGRICEIAVGASERIADQWFDVTMACTLDADAVATIVVETTGVVDMAFESLRLRW
jgi:hypothetical protein